MTKPITILFSILLFASAAPASVDLRWDVETSRVAPVTFDAFHGETLSLKASFTSHSTPLNLAGKTAVLYWQTNGMDSAYWSTNAVTVVSNTATALFTGAMDPGAPAVRGFIGFTAENYRAAFTIRFRPSPGANPSTLPLPTRTLDFATTAVVNPDASPFMVKGGSGGIDAATATNIAGRVTSNVVTKAYVEGLGIEAGISAQTATNIADAVVASSNLCTVAAARAMTNATLSAAKQDAEDKYLPLDGSKYMTGDLEIGNTKQIRWSQGGDSGSISYERFVGGWITFRGANNYWFYNNSGDEFSHLNPDGTPVMTAGAVSNCFPIVTNAYTKAEADALLATKQATISDLSTIRSQASGALPKDGNTPMSGQKLYLFNGQGETTGFVLDNMGVLHIKNVNATGTIKFYGRVETPSDLDVDGSPVATSNMVVAVVDDRADKAVTTAVDNQMKDLLGDNWKTTYGGGLAGLVAAIVAALTWLKSNKLTKGLDAQGVPTDPNVSALFTRANTSLDAAIDYQKKTSGAENHAVYVYAVNSASPSIAIPAVGSGVTDFEVWLDAREYATDYEATFTGATILYKDGAALTFEKSAVTVVHFTACNGVGYTAVSAIFKEVA